MDTIEIPLKIAQRAMRHFHPLVPYVRKRVAELRGQGKKVEEVAEQPEVVKPKKIKKAKE